MGTRVIRSDIAGLVSRIDVAEGDQVAAGDAMLVIEVMKMETPVESPVAGRVCALHAAVGAYIEEGAPLVTLEVG